MTHFQQTFLRELKAFHRAPFLFIGSGLSRRYIKAEDWNALLKKFSELIGENYIQLKAGADGVLPAVASNLADKFFDHWWADAQFEDHRKKYEGQVVKRESCLKIEVADYLRGISAFEVDDVLLQQEIQLFSKVIVDGIITTNYDLFLERVFPEYKSYIGQIDLLFSEAHGIGEIYKIHGCCSKPESLVLTLADYTDYNQRNAYLAAKLLTIFTEHPIIILGYSLADPNVQAILESISACLDDEGLTKLSSRLIMVQWKPDATNVTISSGHSFTFHGRTVPYRKIECPNFLEIFEVLGKLQRKISPKLLRLLKERIFELVKTSSPVSKVFVRDIDESTDLTEADVVIGIGAAATFMKGVEAEEAEMTKSGYKTYNQVELIEEYIKNETLSSNPEHCQKLVEGTFPTLLKGAGLIPIFRFLRCGGYLNNDGSLAERPLDHKVMDSFVSLSRQIHNPTLYYLSKIKAALLPKTKAEFKSWIKSNSPEDAANGVLHLDKNAIDAEVLWGFLVKNISLLKHRVSTNKTNYIKCVLLFDYLWYGTPISDEEEE